MPVEWKTSVSSEGEETLIRGYSVFELASKRPFGDTVFLLLRGELPNPKEGKLFNSILTMTTTHGIGNLSTVGARVAASGGSPVNACIAAGLLALGPHHGSGPAEAAAANFQKNASRSPEQLVTEFKNAGKRMPGYGHPVL
ncbi:hypothetical protein HYS54_05235 [Candidatus Micrarchaeota archaeon]|nr:hypothetical protein [Candidatus Micrarchaeota archaeon]